MQVIANYPIGAAKGGDYVTGASLGEVIEDRGDGTPAHVRAERVLDTGVEIEFEGTLYLGERTVRNAAHLLDMADGWRLDALRAEYLRTADERDVLSQQVARLHDEIDRLRAMERLEAERVYVAVDGSHHASPHAAQSVGRRSRNLFPDVLTHARRIDADEAPLPNPEVTA